VACAGTAEEEDDVKLLQRRLSIRTQLLALFGLLLGAGFCVLVMDELALQDEISTFDSLLHDSLSGLRLAKSISDSYRLEIVDTTFRVRNFLMGWDQGVHEVEVAASDIRRDWQALLATDLSPEQRVLADEIGKVRTIADSATDKLIAILKTQDIKALGRFADTELFPAMDPVTTRLQFLADVKLVDAERSVKEHLAHARSLGWLRIIISVAALIFVIVVGRVMLANVYRGIGRLVHLARNVRDPAFVQAQGFEAGSELGQINDALIAMRSDLLTYEKDLIESEARANAASKAKSSFLASMSHEIRTPMVGVAGMLELLAQTRLDAEQQQQVDIAQSSAQSLLQIIGDILDFSKIEAGKLELNPAPLDLRALVRASTNNFLGTASAKGLRLECRIDERLASAHFGDALRLRQILSNFLSNALKFTEQGEVLVILDRLAAENQRELIALRVKDTGIGITAEDQAHLFQPFAQAGDGGALRGDSTGLGLTICRRLAGLMSGEIVMESKLGAGTTMSLIARLGVADPASLAQAPPVVSERPSRSAPSVAEAEREGSLILLADDHPTNRAVIARQLNQLGYACEGAHDGEAALQMWKSGRFALLLTDLHMPKRDGYALAQAIRADEMAQHRPRAPVIALSANVSTEEVERSRSVGVDDFIAKPTPLNVLAGILHRYLPLQRFIAKTAPAAAATGVFAQSGLDRGLIEDFLYATRDDLVALRAALAKDDAGAVMHEAHRIKGASGLVGASALAAVAVRIESAGRSADLAAAKAGLTDLETEVAHFAAANGIGIS
jgi:signal transduction histidine kinase/CheY-like chemotaxis protein/HPt (histidine-containing phosphotransfer) domain-containing protein